MGRIVVLGGCGGIGSVATRALTTGEWFDEIVVADARRTEAEALTGQLGDPRLRVEQFDATSAESITACVRGASVVLNCVGPFYRFGPPILDVVIAAGVDYVDICDDLDATVAMLERDDAARVAGVTALIGMGNSPGLANVLVRYCADELLDVVEAVDIMHIHGGEPSEGPAVVAHRIHAMTNDVPVFVDGAFEQVRMLEPSGMAHVETTEFRDVGTFPVYPYPHPETITLPRHLPGLRRATNKGVVFPLSYFEATMDAVREGLSTDDAVARVLADRPRLLREAGVEGPAGCLKIVVRGTQAGQTHTYEFSLSSGVSGAGEGTGIPAALGAVLVGQGRIRHPGVVPPEAVVRPTEMLGLAAEVVGHFGMAGGGAVPIHIAHTAPDGSVEDLLLAG